jgi:hypothetical protein
MNLAPLAPKLTHDQRLEVLADRLRDIVTASFISHPMRHTTNAEIKRRLGIVFDFSAEMSRLQGWPIQRCIDTAGTYLDGKLNLEKRFEPDKRRVWVADSDEVI